MMEWYGLGLTDLYQLIVGILVESNIERRYLRAI